MNRYKITHEYPNGESTYYIKTSKTLSDLPEFPEAEQEASKECLALFNALELDYDPNRDFVNIRFYTEPYFVAIDELI